MRTAAHAGNYLNDHPIGPAATVAAVGIKSYVALDSNTKPTKLVASATFPGSAYQTFQTNYGLPTVIGARAGAGFAVDSLPTGGTYSSDNAYVVCTTCHTPHTMFKASASATNPIDGADLRVRIPSFFFIAAPYNPAAQVTSASTLLRRRSSAASATSPARVVRTSRSVSPTLRLPSNQNPGGEIILSPDYRQ